ncbi:MAG: tRNA preQ1(34) S-adenosylmethionine ribosyltransferase-isomerase QueA [candidate division WOR-3 bacterium]|nr:MAG: tRNA preQ1(34) S-adenosylmethionine ribosyltransferase-isomerase QueA [candidate division WOR-3 bacterium]
MKLKELNYELPKELIAQYPLQDRAESKLLVVTKNTGSIAHHTFRDISTFFGKRDVLVLNNTKVFKARLKGKKETGGSIEILLIKEIDKGIWEVMISHAKRTREQTKIFLDNNIYATVLRKVGTRCHIAFNAPVRQIIDHYGIVPLPHYIKRDAVKSDREDYQSVFARREGSVAAPTASLHFTKGLLNDIKKKGVQIAEITLHIGPGTFKPIRRESIEEHTMEAEYFEIPEAAARMITGAQRVIGVGTSVCRALESYANTGVTSGLAELFIYPGYRFKKIDCLITNFHLPCSTTLLLVCAFVGKELLFNAYKQAIDKKYRFLSYGDAMLIL